MRKSLLWILLSSALLLTACTHPPASGSPDSSAGETVKPSLAITHVSVVDVVQGTNLPDQTVLIGEERIVEIQPGAEPLPETVTQIDGSGKYLIPGLVDSHVHYVDSLSFGRLMLANGVLLVRDMGMPTEQAVGLRDALNQGDLLGPEMVATGSILDGDPPLIPVISLGLKTPEEGREAVRRQAKAGVDQIKVYSGLEKEIFLAIVDEAKKQNLKVVGHVPEAVAIEEAAEAGMSSSEHLFGFEKIIGRLLGEPVRLERGGMGPQAYFWLRLGEVDPVQLQQALAPIQATGMAVCPTTIVFRTGQHLNEIYAGTYRLLEYASPKLRELWVGLWPPGSQDSEELGKLWPKMGAFVKILSDEEVPLLVGTDLSFPGIIPGFSLHEEMALWQDMGVPAATILKSATILPATFMGLDSKIGTVEEGKEASLVLLRANPLVDIANAQQIEGVFLRGKYYNRADLDRLLEEAKELAASP
ncbi:MAG: amidohydrolase family protein [bacterium]